jgi:glycosyltransferase involved in cell wall biosynthesis
VRVVHVYKDAYPVVGGIENHIRLLCRELSQQQDMDVRILVTSPTARSSIGVLDGVPVVRAGRIGAPASTPLSPRLPWELRRLRPDLVHLHMPYPVGELSAMLATPRVPTVITYHSDVVRQRTILALYAPVLRRVLRRAARILVSSEPYLRSSPWLAPVADRCRVLPLGIDLAPFLSVTPRSSQPTILFVGRFRYYKGLRYLLEALVALPDVRLMLVGSGPMETSLRAQAHDLGITDRVVFAGGVSDAQLPSYYAAADLFVLPACERSEAFGLVLVEAMASGLPCVSTELGTGTSFVNAHGQSGLVVPPANAGALARACAKLVADPELRARLGAQARARAQALFDIRRLAPQVRSVYEEVLAEA